MDTEIEKLQEQITFLQNEMEWWRRSCEWWHNSCKQAWVDRDINGKQVRWLESELLKSRGYI